MLNIIRYVPEEVSFPGLGIEGLKIDSVAFRIGSLSIYWYGVILAVALSTCVLLAILHSKKHGFSSDLVIDISLVCFPAAIIGARLYYVFSEWEYYKGDILHIINLRDGGLGVIGGVLAAILAGYILAKIRKIPAHVIFDYCIVYIPLGQAIGRWGNFFNQEAFGTNTTLPWGMISDRVSRYLEVYGQGQNPNLPVHPTFLYESLATTAIFLILLIIRNKSKFAFTTTAGYFVLHGVVRFFIEGLRTDSLYIGDTGLRLSQVTSVVMAIVGIALVIISRARGWKRVTTPVDELQKKSLLPQEDIASKATAEAIAESAAETIPDGEAEAIAEETTGSVEEEASEEVREESSGAEEDASESEANEDEAEETADATQEEADVPEDTQSTEADVTPDDESANDGDGADSDPVG